MTGWKSRPQFPATSTRLSSNCEARIQRLVLRALLNSYGAESALRNAVRSGAREMYAAGATCAAVADSLARCIENHPDDVPRKSSLLTGEPRSLAVTRRVRQWGVATFAEDALRQAR